MPVSLNPLNWFKKTPEPLSTLPDEPVMADPKIPEIMDVSTNPTTQAPTTPAQPLPSPIDPATFMANVEKALDERDALKIENATLTTANATLTQRAVEEKRRADENANALKLANEAAAAAQLEARALNEHFQRFAKIAARFEPKK